MEIEDCLKVLSDMQTQKEFLIAQGGMIKEFVKQELTEINALSYAIKKLRSIEK